MISIPSFDKFTLQTTIDHNIIIYEDNRITKTVTLNKFPIFTEVLNISVSGINIKQSPKVIYYV
jgi:hypothetical protein